MHILRFVAFQVGGVVEINAGQVPAIAEAETLPETLVYSPGADVDFLFTLHVVDNVTTSGQAVRDERACQRAAKVAQPPDTGAERRTDPGRASGRYQVRLLGYGARNRLGSVEPGAEKLFRVRSDIAYVVIVHKSGFPSVNRLIPGNNVTYNLR